MFVVELEFDDDERRSAHRPAHRDRLVHLHEAGLLVLAGPWAGDIGALLIFDTDQAGVDQILADDPFYRAPGVVLKAVREWHPIVGR